MQAIQASAMFRNAWSKNTLFCELCASRSVDRATQSRQWNFGEFFKGKTVIMDSSRHFKVDTCRSDRLSVTAQRTACCGCSSKRDIVTIPAPSKHNISESISGYNQYCPVPISALSYRRRLTCSPRDTTKVSNGDSFLTLLAPSSILIRRPPIS